MTWELWEHSGGQTFFPRDPDAALYRQSIDRLLAEEPQAALVWTVEALDYDQAMQSLYTHRGWGTYRPIELDANRDDVPA